MDAAVVSKVMNFYPLALLSYDDIYAKLKFHHLPELKSLSAECHWLENKFGLSSKCELNPSETRLAQFTKIVDNLVEQIEALKVNPGVTYDLSYLKNIENKITQTILPIKDKLIGRLREANIYNSKTNPSTGSDSFSEHESAINAANASERFYSQPASDVNTMNMMSMSNEMKYDTSQSTSQLTKKLRAKSSNNLSSDYGFSLELPLVTPSSSSSDLTLTSSTIDSVTMTQSISNISTVTGNNHNTATLTPAPTKPTRTRKPVSSRTQSKANKLSTGSATPENVSPRGVASMCSRLSFDTTSEGYTTSSSSTSTVSRSKKAFNVKSENNPTTTTTSTITSASLAMPSTMNIPKSLSQYSTLTSNEEMSDPSVTDESVTDHGFSKTNSVDDLTSLGFYLNYTGTTTSTLNDDSGFDKFNTNIKAIAPSTDSYFNHDFSLNHYRSTSIDYQTSSHLSFDDMDLTHSLHTTNTNHTNNTNVTDGLLSNNTSSNNMFENTTLKNEHTYSLTLPSSTESVTSAPEKRKFADIQNTSSKDNAFVQSSMMSTSTMNKKLLQQSTYVSSSVAVTPTSAVSTPRCTTVPTTTTTAATPNNTNNNTTNLLESLSFTDDEFRMSSKRRRRLSQIVPYPRKPRSADYNCSICNEMYTRVSEDNPWWAVYQHECPSCHNIQIPRLDISLMSNAIELDPNVVALYGEGIDDSDVDGFEGYTLLDSEDCVDTTEEDTCTPADMITEDLIDDSILDGRKDAYCFNEVGLLSDEQASKLLVLMTHARTCTGQHTSTQHAEICQSTKYLMLHLRDCNGFDMNGKVCRFTWCQPCKKMLKHLTRCFNCSQCNVCNPWTCNSESTQQLKSLNAIRAPPMTMNTEKLSYASKLEIRDEIAIKMDMKRRQEAMVQVPPPSTPTTTTNTTATSTMIYTNNAIATMNDSTANSAGSMMSSYTDKITPVLMTNNSYHHMPVDGLTTTNNLSTITTNTNDIMRFHDMSSTHDLLTQDMTMSMMNDNITMQAIIDVI